MKKNILCLGRLLASFAVILATLNVNSTCLFASYQPRIPDSLKELRKF